MRVIEIVQCIFNLDHPVPVSRVSRSRNCITKYCHGASNSVIISKEIRENIRNWMVELPSISPNSPGTFLRTYYLGVKNTLLS